MGFPPCEDHASGRRYGRFQTLAAPIDFGNSTPPIRRVLVLMRTQTDSSARTHGSNDQDWGRGAVTGGHDIGEDLLTLALSHLSTDRPAWSAIPEFAGSCAHRLRVAAPSSLGPAVTVERNRESRRVFAPRTSEVCRRAPGR